MEKLYYSSTLMWGASPQQILFRAARAGVAGLEIWAQQADTFGWQPEMLGELARRAGLELLVHAKSWDLNFAALNEGVRRASVEELKRSLEFASRCGAGEMTLHPPRFTLPGLKAQAMEAGARGLEELLDTAQGLGIEISLEVMEKLPKELVTTPEEYRAFTGGLLPRLSCTLDLAHCQNEGEFWDYLSRLPRISKLHISNKQGKKLHTPLAQGDFNFLWLMPRLQKLDLPLVIEGFDGDGRFEILKSDLELCQIQEEKMRKSVKSSLAAALAALTALSLAGCQSGASSSVAASAAASGSESAPASSQAEAAPEGTLTLYTSQPEADAQALIEAFNEQYPDVTVNVFRSGTEEIISKVLAEKETGALQADVLLVSDAATFEGLKGEDLLLSYESPELEGIDPSYYDADHTYTGTKIISTGIVVNTDLIENIPTSLADLTKPEYADELAMPSPLYSGAAAYNLSVLVRTEGMGWEFYEGLKANNVQVGQGNGGVQTAVVNGEKGLGLLVDYMALRSKAEGAPVEFVYPEEGSLCVTEPVGILKESQNQELAKLFVDFILSEEGQKTTAEIGYTPIKKGVEAPEGFRTADEIQNLTYDMATLVSEREADKEAFAEMFGA